MVNGVVDTNGKGREMDTRTIPEMMDAGDARAMAIRTHEAMLAKLRPIAEKQTGKARAKIDEMIQVHEANLQELTNGWPGHVYGAGLKACRCYRCTGRR